MDANVLKQQSEVRMDVSSKTKIETVCQEAERLVGGPRQQHYGPPTENFQRIADLWNGYLGHDLKEPVTVQDVCAMMILLKQARMRTGRSYHRDSAVDTCGYAYLQELLAS